MGKHTALPWSIAKTGEIISLACRAPNPKSKAFRCVAWHGSDVHQITPEDAELIVLGVNAIPLLKECMAVIEGEICSSCPEPCCRNLRSVLDKLKALNLEQIKVAPWQGSYCSVHGISQDPCECILLKLLDAIDNESQKNEVIAQRASDGRLLFDGKVYAEVKE